MRRPTLVLVASALVAGCASDIAMLESSGAGGGERSRALTCDGGGAFADAVLSLDARAEAGSVSVIVLDGARDLVHERHVARLSGSVTQETTLTGAPGEWSVEERRTDDFRGELVATLRCA